MEYKIEMGELVMTNGLFTRRILLPEEGGKYLLKEYRPLRGEFAFMDPDADGEEFAFTLNDVTYTGATGWKLDDVKKAEDLEAGEGVVVSLRALDTEIGVQITYIWYPELPFVRKRLKITNGTSKEQRLESVDVEQFQIGEYAAPTFSWIYSDYGRKKSIGPYRGTLQDSLIVIHHPDWESGIVLGNEAPGVLKGASVWSRGRKITLGLTHADEDFPFRKYLAAGESFTAPDVFTGVYSEQKDIHKVMNQMVSDYVRKYMGIRLSRFDEAPVYVYNTWEPFEFDIDEKMVMETAKAAAEAGIKEYVIDDGWDDCYGDWGIDYEKFPNGLRPVVDYIKSLGMKAGVWVSIGTASPKSKVYKEHPEWFFKNQDGKDCSLVIEADNKCTACFSTGWADYILGVLERLVDEYGFDYLKLDFSVVSSPYRYTKEEAGCYACDHPGHRDREESMWENYDRMWKVFDKLHEGRENLFIDCTFETMGGLQLVDYAMLKHAEGNWLSNFKGDLGEKTDLRIRQMAWWRSPAIPATSLVIGNAEMQDEGYENHIRSLAGALPIFCGDPRRLPETGRQVMKKYSEWLQKMEDKYRIMFYRQDLPGYFEPTLGGCDGFARINREDFSGGIIGFFRHGGAEDTRMVRVDGLIEDKIYQILNMEGNEIICMSGKQMEEKGFAVTIEEKFGGRLYEIAVRED
ncbi:MAG: alpha-galactosidase [Clostridia bacterium]|nr:alpha-galactosidase [Clostridia bacterium]NCC44586.1 alpha-galactosidase [Clostridia bacterium]